MKNTARYFEIRDGRAWSVASGSFYSEKFAKSFCLAFDAENLRVEAAVERDEKSQILFLKEFLPFFFFMKRRNLRELNNFKRAF